MLWVVLLGLISRTVALTCYDCYSTGPENKECTKERSCTGVACMIFDAGDNKTSTAFCLLAIRGENAAEQKSGCWIEPDGKGKHCMCHTDFCNKLVDRSELVEDPLAPLLPDAQFLKQNPLIDYENPTIGDEDQDGSKPAPHNILFPGVDKEDPRVAGDDNDDDLVPVDFEEYDNKDTNKMKDTEDVIKPRTQDRVPVQSASFVNPPPSVLVGLTMAASWARVFMFI